MARSINQIYSYLEDAYVTIAGAVGIIVDPSKWSKTDHKRFAIRAVAVGQAVLEQIHDSTLEDLEIQASKLSPQTPQWIRDKMLNLFEYDATNVPIVQLNQDLVPYYPNPNPNQRIVKYSSVVPGIFGTTTVKIAGEGPSQIIGTAIDAAQTFVNLIGVPGITYNVISKVSDKLFMQLDVYYNGLYSATIQSSVISKINEYLKGIDFDGKIDFLELLKAIDDVPGVNTVVPVNIIARDNSTAFGGGTNLVMSGKIINKDYQTIAGYIVPETTVGKTLTDFRSGVSGPLNLNLIPQ